MKFPVFHVIVFKEITININILIVTVIVFNGIEGNHDSFLINVMLGNYDESLDISLNW